MKHPATGFRRFFTALMLFFCAFLAAFVLLRSGLDFRIGDLTLSLETSRGRERKQQYEFDQVTEELPLTRAELEAEQPRAEAAAETVRLLKEERKQLRAEKKALEEAAAEPARNPETEAAESPAGTKEGAGD